MTASVPPPVPIDQRFAQLIQQFGLTKNSFAMSLGKTASVVQHLIDGRNKPGYDLLCKVFEIYPNVSRDWLLLGRGPMLVSGEHAPKVAAPTVPQPPLEPIDLSDVEISAPRRPGLGVAGTRLQPAEIAATLALAAAANQPVRAAEPAPFEAAESSALPEMPATAAASDALAAAQIPVAPQTVVANPAAPITQGFPASTIPASSVETPVSAVASAPSPSIASPVSAAPASGAAPEAYVAAALNAQYLQHQLALAELRNQHLLEQQQMLREMLAMARQAMV